MTGDGDVRNGTGGPRVVRRPGGDTPWSGLPRQPGSEPVTSRLRRIVEELPDWEPLPPGEILVRRPGSGE